METLADSTCTHNPADVSLSLRPYQLEALDAMAAAEARGERYLLVALPTGTGKTIIFCELIRRRQGRSLVLVHRDELITQTIEKLGIVAPDLAIGIVKAEKDEHDADVVIASVQTLSREARLARVVADFSTIVPDECHHVTADSYRRVLDHLGKTALVAGFTATPFRGDGESIAALFPSITYSKSLLDMIQQGYLADLRALRVQLAVDFHDLHRRAGDFIAGECADLLRAGNFPALLAATYHEHAAHRRGLVFVPTMDLAEDCAAALIGLGITAEPVTSETPLTERRDLLRRFRAGDVRVITNCGVLTEGYDEAAVECVVIARPTKSKTLYVQMLGRGTRRAPGKADCLVLDVSGATERHDLMSLGSVFDLPPARLHDGNTITEAVASYQQHCALVEARAADVGRLMAQSVNLFQTRPLHWVVVRPEQHFVLPVGARGAIHVCKFPDGMWRASLHGPGGSLTPILVRNDRDYAIGTAEDFARTLGVTPLLSRAAAWRTAVATPKQRATLRRLRIPVPVDLTRGGASDLIAAGLARRWSTW